MLVKMPPWMPRTKMVPLLEAAFKTGIPFSYPEEQGMPRGGEQLAITASLIERIRAHDKDKIRTFGMRFHFPSEEDAVLFKLKYV